MDPHFIFGWKNGHLRAPIDLAQSFQEIVRYCWDDTWNLPIEGILSNPRVEEFMKTQWSLMHL